MVLKKLNSNLILSLIKSVACLTVCMIIIYAIAFLNATPVFRGYANKYELYIGDNSSCASVISVNADEYPFIHNIYGESCTITGDFNLTEFLSDMNASLIFYENIGDGMNYYAYSPKIKYKKEILGKTVNLHVYISKSKIKVGSPLIYGGY